jgi:hypothetical protein
LIGGAILDWPGNPDSSADSLPLRLAGGLNALVRRGDAPELASCYPPNPLPDPDRWWARLADVLAEKSSELLRWLALAPQTNEVGRSAILFAGLSYLASIRDDPVDLFEVGASAGLNLNLDRYGYRFAGEQFGDAGSPLQLAPAWEGPLPPRSAIAIASRRGCDLSPLDPTKAQDRERLLAYIWPDQAGRVDRLSSALDIAAHHPVTTDWADAADWVERNITSGGFPVLMHSVAFQYFPVRSQQRIAAHMENLGAGAPLAWLRFELDPELENRFSLRFRLWPDGSDRLLAIAGPHGASIEWLAR